MRSVFFGFLIFILWAAFARYYYVCEIKDLCAEPKIELPERPQTLNLTFEDKVVLEGFDQFEFKKGDRLPSLNENNKTFLDSLAAILKQKPDRNVTITGAFLESEKDAPLKGTFQENLGLARGEAIRKYLVANYGIDEKRISLDHRLASGDRLFEPITFSLFPRGVDEENPKEYAKVQFSFHDMTYSDANFEVDSYVFNPGAAFKSYADSVITYLQSHKNLKLSIIGHTDDDGNPPYNETLGKKRAESARKYFKQKGLKSKIITLSKGEKQPIAPNNTDANKQKNRRVNFVIE